MRHAWKNPPSVIGPFVLGLSSTCASGAVLVPQQRRTLIGPAFPSLAVATVDVRAVMTSRFVAYQLSARPRDTRRGPLDFSSDDEHRFMPTRRHGTGAVVQVWQARQPDPPSPPHCAGRPASYDGGAIGRAADLLAVVMRIPLCGRRGDGLGMAWGRRLQWSKARFVGPTAA